MKRKTLVAEILCTGEELLLGDIVNTNAAFLSAELTKLGIYIYHHSVVGDDSKRLKDADVCAEIKPNDAKIITTLAKMTEGFIGSEIEQVVISALCDAFFENRALQLSDFEKAIKNTVPLSQTQKEQILAIREWANIRAVCASSKESIQKYTETPTPQTPDDKTTQDVNASRGGRRLDV